MRNEYVGFHGARQVAFGAVNGKSVAPQWAEDSSYGAIPQGSPACVQRGLGRSTCLPEFSSGGKKNYLGMDSNNFCSTYFDTENLPRRNKACGYWVYVFESCEEQQT